MNLFWWLMRQDDDGGDGVLQPNPWCSEDTKEEGVQVGRRSFLATAVSAVGVASLISPRSLFFDVQEEDYLQRLGRMTDVELRTLRAAPFSSDPSGFYSFPVGVRKLDRLNPLDSDTGVAVTLHFCNWPATRYLITSGMTLLMPDGREICRLRWGAGAQTLCSGDILKMSYSIRILDLRRNP